MGLNIVFLRLLLLTLAFSPNALTAGQALRPIEKRILQGLLGGDQHAGRTSSNFPIEDIGSGGVRNDGVPIAREEEGKVESDKRIVQHRFEQMHPDGRLFHFSYSAQVKPEAHILTHDPILLRIQCDDEEEEEDGNTRQEARQEPSHDSSSVEQSRVNRRVEIVLNRTKFPKEGGIESLPWCVPGSILAFPPPNSPKWDIRSSFCKESVTSSTTSFRLSSDPQNPVSNPKESLGKLKDPLLMAKDPLPNPQDPVLNPRDQLPDPQDPLPNSLATTQRVERVVSCVEQNPRSPSRGSENQSEVDADIQLVYTVVSQPLDSKRVVDHVFSDFRMKLFVGNGAKSMREVANQVKSHRPAPKSNRTEATNKSEAGTLIDRSDIDDKVADTSLSTSDGTFSLDVESTKIQKVRDLETDPMRELERRPLSEMKNSSAKQSSAFHVNSNSSLPVKTERGDVGTEPRNLERVGTSLKPVETGAADTGGFFGNRSIFSGGDRTETSTADVKGWGDMVLNSGNRKLLQMCATDDDCVKSAGSEGVFCLQDRLVCSDCHSSCRSCTETTRGDCTGCYCPVSGDECLVSLTSGEYCAECMVDADCPEGKFCDEAANGVHTCSSCNAQCAQCEGFSAQDCTACDPLTDFPYLVIKLGSVTAGRCEECSNSNHCPAGTYCENNADNPNTCDQCHEECQLCAGRNRNDCLTCNPGWSRVPRDSGVYCEPCMGDKQCGAGEFCFMGDTQHACLPCSESCSSCSGETAADCTACRDGFIQSQAATPFECLVCPACDAESRCTVTSTGTTKCSSQFSCGDTEVAQDECEDIDGLFTEDGRAKVIVKQVRLQGSTWGSSSFSAVMWSESYNEMGGTLGGAVDQRQIILDGITSLNQDYIVDLVIGAVHPDQPIRVGVWQVEEGVNWMLDLEGSSRGDVWLHPFDFAAAPNSEILLSGFSESQFSLQCSGCAALVQAANPQAFDSSRLQYSAQGSSQVPTANINLWNWNQLGLSAAQAELLLLNNELVQATTSTGSVKWYQARVLCRDCHLKLDNGGADLYFEINQGGDEGIDSAALLAHLNIFAKIATEVTLRPTLSEAFDADISWEGPLGSASTSGPSFISSLSWEVQVAGVSFQTGLALDLKGKLDAHISRTMQVNNSFVARYDADFGYTYSYDTGMYPIALVGRPEVSTADDPGLIVDDVGSLSFEFIPTLKVGMWENGDLSGSDVPGISADMTSSIFARSDWELSLGTFSSSASPSSTQTSFGPCSAAEHNIRMQGEVGVDSNLLELKMRAPLQWNQGEQYPGYSWKGSWGAWSVGEIVDSSSGFLLCKCQAPGCEAGTSNVPNAEEEESPPSGPTNVPEKPAVIPVPNSNSNSNSSNANNTTNSNSNSTSPTGDSTTNSSSPSFSPPPPASPQPSLPPSFPPSFPARSPPPPFSAGPIEIIGGSSPVSETSTFDVEASMEVEGLSFADFQDAVVMQKFTAAIAEILAPMPLNRISVVAKEQQIGRRLQQYAAVDVDVVVSDFDSQSAANEAKSKLSSSIADGTLASTATWQLSVYGYSVSGVREYYITVVEISEEESPPPSEGLIDGDLELVGIAVPKLYLAGGVAVLFLVCCCGCGYKCCCQKSKQDEDDVEKATLLAETEKEEKEVDGEGGGKSGGKSPKTPKGEDGESEAGVGEDMNKDKGAEKEEETEVMNGSTPHPQGDEGPEPGEDQRSQRVDGDEDNNPGSAVGGGGRRKPQSPVEKPTPVRKKSVLDPLPAPGDAKPQGHKDVMSAAMRKRGGLDSILGPPAADAPPSAKKKGKGGGGGGGDLVYEPVIEGAAEGANESGGRGYEAEMRLSDATEISQNDDHHTGPKRRGRGAERGVSLDEDNEYNGPPDHYPGQVNMRGSGEFDDGHVRTPSTLLPPVFTQPPLPPPLSPEERDLMMWLKEQAMDHHFESFRSRGVCSIEDVIFKVDPVMLADIGQISRMQARLILSSIKMQKMLINVHRMGH